MFLDSKTMHSSRSVDSQSILSDILIKIFDTPYCRTGGEVPRNNRKYYKVVESFDGEDGHITNAMVQDWWQ